MSDYAKFLVAGRRRVVVSVVDGLMTGWDDAPSMRAGAGRFDPSGSVRRSTMT
jgi:hypothetical protein